MPPELVAILLLSDGADYRGVGAISGGMLVIFTDFDATNTGY